MPGWGWRIQDGLSFDSLRLLASGWVRSLLDRAPAQPTMVRARVEPLFRSHSDPDIPSEAMVRSMRLECDPDVYYRTQQRTHMLLESCGLLDDAWQRDREDGAGLAETWQRWGLAVEEVRRRQAAARRRPSSPSESASRSFSSEALSSREPGRVQTFRPDLGAAWEAASLRSGSRGSLRSAGADLGEGSSPRSSLACPRVANTSVPEPERAPGSRTNS